MGNALSSAFSSAMRKLGGALGGSIGVPMCLSRLNKAVKDFGTLGSSKLDDVIDKICTKYSKPQPTQADILGYQSALRILNTILKGFEGSVPDNKLLKAEMGNYIRGSAVGSVPPVAPATKAQIVSRIGTIMGWGTNVSLVQRNFNTVVAGPLGNFTAAMMSHLSPKNQADVVADHKVLFMPCTVCMAIYDIIN